MNFLNLFPDLRQKLVERPCTWLVTGVGGFIGSHLLETLLRLDQRVIGLDDFSTGSPKNLEEVQSIVAPEQWSRFILHRGSVADLLTCQMATRGVDFILHHAGFISVPLSLEDPLGCHETNVTGTLNVLLAAREHGVQRVVYASSSAVYGDDPRPAKIESQIGRPLSPYGASKRINEIYADQCFAHYGLASVGLRYFNVFGPRQNPTGGYAAVIPQWITALVRGDDCQIHGDGGITRDFCHVHNVVQANLLAATTENPRALGQVFNVALGGSTTLSALYEMIANRVASVTGRPLKPVQKGPPRPGDIQQSSADITAIGRELGFDPQVSVDDGLEETVRWYAAQLR